MKSKNNIIIELLENFRRDFVMNEIATQYFEGLLKKSEERPDITSQLINLKAQRDQLLHYIEIAKRLMDEEEKKDEEEAYDKN